MFEIKAIIVFINILQFIATLLVASEYFINRKKLRMIEKNYNDRYKKMTLASNDKIDILNENYQNNKIRNIIKLVLSFSGVIILLICGSLIMEDNIISQYIVLGMITYMLLLFMLIYLIMIYTIKLLEHKVEKFNHIFYYTVIGKFIFKRPSYPLVRLGLFLFAVSFILNIWVILEWNKNILSLLIIFLFLAVFLYLGVLYESYTKLHKKRKI